MKENSKMWRFLFGENVSRKVARSFIIADVIIIICALLFMPDGDGNNLFGKAKQAVITYQVAQNEQKAKKEIAAPISGYSFVRYYHLVVADTKKDQAYYYGQQAAIFKGDNNYLLCYKADGEVKELPFKKWSDGNCKGLIVEDESTIRFATVSPDEDGCEFAFCRNGAFCEFYFYRKI